jgi:hypothetical protein
MTRAKRELQRLERQVAAHTQQVERLAAQGAALRPRATAQAALELQARALLRFGELVRQGSAVAAPPAPWLAHVQWLLAALEGGSGGGGGTGSGAGSGAGAGREGQPPPPQQQQQQQQEEEEQEKEQEQQQHLQRPWPPSQPEPQPAPAARPRNGAPPLPSLKLGWSPEAAAAGLAQADLSRAGFAVAMKQAITEGCVLMQCVARAARAQRFSCPGGGCRLGLLCRAARRGGPRPCAAAGSAPPGPEPPLPPLLPRPRRRMHGGAPDAAAAPGRLAALCSWFNGFCVQISCTDFRLMSTLLAEPMTDGGGDGGPPPRPPEPADWAWAVQQMRLTPEQVRGAARGRAGRAESGPGRSAAADRHRPAAAHRSSPAVPTPAARGAACRKRRPCTAPAPPGPDPNPPPPPPGLARGRAARLHLGVV